MAVELLAWDAGNPQPITPRLLHFLYNPAYSPTLFLADWPRLRDFHGIANITAHFVMRLKSLAPQHGLAIERVLDLSLHTHDDGLLHLVGKDYTQPSLPAIPRFSYRGHLLCPSLLLCYQRQESRDVVPMATGHVYVLDLSKRELPLRFVERGSLLGEDIDQLGYALVA
jgi:hypothetical protein